MEKSYQGNRKPFATILCTKDDFVKFQGTAEFLNNKISLNYNDNGQAPSLSIMKKASAVIAVFSESFYKDESLLKALFDAAGANVEIIPVKTDVSDVPDSITQLLYSIHAIDAIGSDDERTAQLILSSKALENPHVTKNQTSAFRKIALISATVAAIIIAALVVLIIKTSTPSTAKQFLLQYGINKEDLENARHVLILGDQIIINENDHENLFNYVYDDWDEDNNNIFYFLEDGSIIPDGTLTDLSILDYMPYLKKLDIVNQPQLETLPDFSNYKNILSLSLFNCGINDVSPLNNSRLTSLQLRCIPAIDFSTISDCQLSYFELAGSLATNINGITTNLNSISLFNNNYLTDISALSKCTKIKNVDFNANGQLNDVSALANSSFLQNIHLGHMPISDLSLFEGMSHVRSIDLQNLQIENLDFLRGLDIGNGFLGLCVYCNSLRDFSGIESIKSFGRLDIGSLLDNNNFQTAFNPYINGSVNEIKLSSWNNISFERLTSTRKIELDNINLTDLSPLNGLNVNELRLFNCNYLSSLNGLENVSNLSHLYISNCIRISNYEALYSCKNLMSLELFGLNSPPDFSRINMAQIDILSLGYMDAIDDLSIIKTIQANDKPLSDINSLKLVGLNNVRSLSCLNDISINEIITDGILMDEANTFAERQLSETGLQCRVSWSEDDYNYGNSDIQILSLDELDSFSDKLLDRVKYFSLWGNIVCQDCHWEKNEDDTITLINNNTNTVISTIRKELNEIDCSKLARMKHLNSLFLFNQKLINTKELQALAELENIHLEDCESDGISSLFVLPNLRRIELFAIKDLSFEGIENLVSLKEIQIDEPTYDLSPLLKCSTLDKVIISGNSNKINTPEIQAFVDAAPFEVEIKIRD